MDQGSLTTVHTQGDTAQACLPARDTPHNVCHGQQLNNVIVLELSNGLLRVFAFGKQK